MKLLFDTDTLVLLLSLGWFDATCSILNVRDSDCSRLEAAPHMIKKARWVARRYPTLDREVAARTVNKLGTVPIGRQVGIRNSLTQIDHIDPGEAELLVIADETPDAVILTGDKKFLIALGEADEPAVVRLRKRLSGRILFFPQLLIPLSRALTLSAMDANWRPASIDHKDLKIAFGTQAPVAKERFHEGIAHATRGVIETMGSAYLYEI